MTHATAEAISPWMTAEECAAYLRNKSVSTIYKLVHRKQIPFHKPGGLLLFDRTEIDAWVRNSSEKQSKEIKGSVSRFQSVKQRLQSSSLKTDSTVKPIKSLSIVKGDK